MPRTQNAHAFPAWTVRSNLAFRAMHVKWVLFLPRGSASAITVQRSVARSMLERRAATTRRITRPAPAPLFEPFGFVRIHREHTVNLAHIRLLRLQADGRDWELNLEPPASSLTDTHHAITIPRASRYMDLKPDFTPISSQQRGIEMRKSAIVLILSFLITS
jgi:hypothetical protein